MATLIPSIGTGSFETSGERRLAERLEQKLGNDYGPSTNTNKVMTMKVSKGLEFPVVALAGVGTCAATAETRKGPRGCFMWR